MSVSQDGVFIPLGSPHLQIYTCRLNRKAGDSPASKLPTRSSPATGTIEQCVNAPASLRRSFLQSRLAPKVLVDDTPMELQQQPATMEPSALMTPPSLAKPASTSGQAVRSLLDTAVNGTSSHRVRPPLDSCRQGHQRGSKPPDRPPAARCVCAGQRV